jgi:hypothetical protein
LNDSKQCEQRKDSNRSSYPAEVTIP